MQALVLAGARADHTSVAAVTTLLAAAGFMAVVAPVIAAIIPATPVIPATTVVAVVMNMLDAVTGGRDHDDRGWAIAIGHAPIGYAAR